MLTVQEMIQTIRSTVHDNKVLEYTDEQIIGTINAGIRFIRRQIKTIRPQMLMDSPITGMLQQGTESVDLPVEPTKVIDVHINGRAIKAINFLDIKNPTRRGRPMGYYLTGLKTLCVFPVPAEDVQYTIRVVGSAKRLTQLNDKSPLPDDMDDILIEYACIRLSMSNEFDMSAESQIMSAIIGQIQDVVLNIEDRANAVSGYFDPFITPWIGGN